MDAEVSVVQYEDKIKILLEKFLDPNFIITTDTYLNTLLSHLSGKDNKGLGNALLNLPIVTEWLVSATKYWEDSGSCPSSNIISFIIQLTSLLSDNEARFNQLNSCNIYIRIFTVLKIRYKNSSPSIKLSYIKLLSSFLQHSSGINWLIATDNWQDVLEYSLESQTTYVSRDAHNFIFNLLNKGSRCNPVFSTIVIEKITTTFNELNFINGLINDESLEKKLTPSLRLIAHILDSCIQTPSFSDGDFIIPSIFLKNCHLEQNIWSIIMISSQNENLFDHLNKIMILVHLFGLAIDSETRVFQCHHLKKMNEQIFKLITMNINKGFMYNIAKMCYLLQYYWKLLDPRLPSIDFNADEVQILFEDQILVFQVMPICMISFNECLINFVECSEDEFRDHFITKVIKTLCTNTVRVSYNFRTTLTNVKYDLYDIAVQATAYIMKTRRYYHRNGGILVFQFFMYTFYDIVEGIKKKPKLLDVFSKKHSYFNACFDVLSTFIKEFDITWRESVETICVMSLTLDFISLTCWNPKLIVQGLRLVNLSISRFMSPNLALLVEGTSDSSMTKLGAMLTSKLHDREWEIRDSALEVLQTISSIALQKYPSYQTMVVDLELPAFMITMCMHDSESYVRASAIKCLQEMIKVPKFWNSVLRHQDLPSKMMQILYNETEAIVRCEAACLMSRIYEYQLFPKESKNQIYQAMLFAATTDLDWEVRENALDYWGKVIIRYLTNQGMIDGTFPSVTFSKEDRKIVNLTEMEIRNRLQKVLVELSMCGCLGALLNCMQDNCDIKVLKKSVAITQTLSRILKLYNVTSDVPCPLPTTPGTPKTVTNTFNFDGSSTIKCYSDKIVNDIVNSRDIGLLTNVMGNNQEIYVPSNETMKQYIVSPKNFLVFVQRDLNELIEERTKWLHQIDDLGSLLDDILKCYSGDINAMDCY